METGSFPKTVTRDPFSIGVLLGFGVSSDLVAKIPDGALRPIVAAIAIPFNDMTELSDQVSVRRVREHVIAALIRAAGAMLPDSVPMYFAEQLREPEVTNVTAGIILERVCKMIEAYDIPATGTAIFMPSPQ